VSCVSSARATGCGAVKRSVSSDYATVRRYFWQSWKAFSRALASGQLEGILAMPICQEMLDRDAPATRRRLHAGDW
jgi:hypothetical protein